MDAFFIITRDSFIKQIEKYSKKEGVVYVDLEDIYNVSDGLYQYIINETYMFVFLNMMICLNLF